MKDINKIKNIDELEELKIILEKRIKELQSEHGLTIAEETPGEGALSLEEKPEVEDNENFSLFKIFSKYDVEEIYIISKRKNILKDLESLRELDYEYLDFTDFIKIEVLGEMGTYDNKELVFFRR